METTGLQRGGRRMKARAPPPPNHPPMPCKVNNEHNLGTELGSLPDQSVMDMKENLIKRTVDFTVVFPDGEEQKETVPGSKAVMDLLVDLCSRHHLNPAHHILELRSWETQYPLNYKPNTMIGILDVQKIILKEKLPEEKFKQPPLKIPEKTVRLVVNYLKTQKAVVRVNPEVPLHYIIPAICEKCEVSQEHLVLLRDTFTGEELELTKSLNELGIKELYAWDRKKVLPSRAQSEPSLNYRERRIFSTSIEATEKEKKRFLGFFKTNKRTNKAEENLTVMMDWDYGSEEPLKTTAASEQSLDEAITVPHSSSVSSYSVPLGPSLSVGNVSAVTGSTEIKKRRAPPPPAILSQLPSVETNGDENILSQQMSQSSSQNGLQKKKRRAPPPPIPPVPNRMEDQRKSTVGHGQPVPQKPPRGNTRDPPQLVIPPPPPYPPFDRDTMESTVLYNEADVSDPIKLVPKHNLQASHDTNSMDNIVLELSETDETISVNSCFASEDTTEDSDVMSSPSDVLSLNSQNGSMSSRSKSVDSQETEMAPVLVAEVCSIKDDSFNGDHSGNIYQRDKCDTEVMEAKVENSDIFIADRLKDTLAELDKDLAAIEDMHDTSENESLSCAPIPPSQAAETAQDVSLPVPVTIIDEIPEVDIKIQCSREEERCLLSKRESNQDISVQSICLGEETNENNNSGSFIEECVDPVSPCLCEDLSPQQSPKEDVRHQMEKEQKDDSDIYVPSCEQNNNTCQEVMSQNKTDSEESKAKVIDSSLGFMNKLYEQRSKEDVRLLNKDNTQEELPSKMKIDLEIRPASEKKFIRKEASLLPSIWCHRIDNGLTDYEPKIGLTTFKVIPPKPDVKYFDRDVSLSTGAIKIDELGNLVTPNGADIGKVTGNKTSNDSQDTLNRTSNTPWKSNSMGKKMKEFPVDHSTKPVVITHSKPFNKISNINLDCLIRTANTPWKSNLMGKKLEEFPVDDSTKPVVITHSKSFNEISNINLDCLIRTANTPWKSNSMGEKLEEFPVDHSTKPVVITHSKPFNEISNNNPDCLIRTANTPWKSNSMGEKLEEFPVDHSTKPVVITHSKPFNEISNNNPDCLIRTANTPWKLNSMGGKLEEFPVDHSTKPVVITHSKPFNEISNNNPDCLTNMKMTISSPFDSMAVKNNTETEKTKPPVIATESSMKTVRDPVVSTNKTVLRLQKPQKITSSHYLASIIAKYIDSAQFETNQERQSREEETSNEKGIESDSQKCIIVSGCCPVETQSAKVDETYSSCRKTVSNVVPVGVHSRITNNTTNIKLPYQTKSSHCDSAPSSATLSKNSNIPEKEPISGSMQKAINRQIPPVLNQKKEKTDQASPPSFRRSSDVPSSSMKPTLEHRFSIGSSASLDTLTVSHMFSNKNEKHGDSGTRSEPESNNDIIYDVFGPKKKFKPVIQKPVPKDMSLHSALMEAIQTSGGRDKLRKSSPSARSGTQKKPSFTEPENERSSLLAAIREHNGISGLRKTSSSASEELQSFHNAEILLQNEKASIPEPPCNQLPLPPPQPPPKLTKKIPRSFTNEMTKNTVDTRQALMEAIRSGAGAARLRKVPQLV
nr:protein cordon-bleu isoform X1 [Anolis sagrei ordinatus]